MNIKSIRTEQDYEAALRAVEPMFDNEPEMNFHKIDIRNHGSLYEQIHQQKN